MLGLIWALIKVCVMLALAGLVLMVFVKFLEACLQASQKG